MGNHHLNSNKFAEASRWDHKAIENPAEKRLEEMLLDRAAAKPFDKKKLNQALLMKAMDSRRICKINLA